MPVGAGQGGRGHTIAVASQHHIEHGSGSQGGAHLAGGGVVAKSQRRLGRGIGGQALAWSFVGGDAPWRTGRTSSMAVSVQNHMNSRCIEGRLGMVFALWTRDVININNNDDK